MATIKGTVTVPKLQTISNLEPNLTYPNPTPNLTPQKMSRSPTVNKIFASMGIVKNNWWWRRFSIRMENHWNSIEPPRGRRRMVVGGHVVRMRPLLAASGDAGGGAGAAGRRVGRPPRRFAFHGLEPQTKKKQTNEWRHQSRPEHIGNEWLVQH